MVGLWLVHYSLNLGWWVLAPALYLVYHVEAFGRPKQRTCGYPNCPNFGKTVKYEYVLPPWAYLVMSWALYLSVLAEAFCHLLINTPVFDPITNYDVGLWSVWWMFVVMIHLWPIIFFKYAHFWIGAIVSTVTFLAACCLIVLYGYCGYWVSFGISFIPALLIAVFMGINWYFAVRCKAMYPTGVHRKSGHALPLMFGGGCEEHKSK